MSLWKWLTGGGDTINKGMDMVDNAFYTDQEKAEHKGMFLKFYEPFKIAQRLLALTFCPVYCFAWILTFLTELFSALWGNKLDLENVYALLGGNMALMVTLILGFYFAGGAAEGVVDRLTKVRK